MRISGLLREKGDFVATVAPGATIPRCWPVWPSTASVRSWSRDDGEHIAGIVSERDIARALHRHGTARAGRAGRRRS